MSLLDILKLLSQNNIQIGLENDQLKVSAAKGAMTKELMQLLKDNKEALLTWAREKQQQQGIPAITPVSRDQHLPLSFNQQGLWFIYRLAPETASYNMPMALRLKGPLNLTALQQAMNGLLARHEILRTRLLPEQDDVVQSVLPVAEWSFTCEPLTDEAALNTLIKTEALTPFQLEDAPLFRTRLWQLAEDDVVFMVTLHHIIADAASIQNLLVDLAALYQAAVHNTAPALDELPIQYADYAWWQHNVLAKGFLDKQLDYWQQQLRQVPALLHIPTDKPRPAVQTHNGAIVHQALSSTTVKRAKEFALQNNLTPFMVFLAAQQLLLGRYAKQEDVCVAVPIAGRHLAGTERLVGFFINTLIMRNRFADNPSVKTYLENTRDIVLGAFSHQDAPLDRVIEKLSIQRSTAYSPVAQIGFNYLVVAPGTQTTNSFRIDDLSIELIEQTEVEAKYDMIWGLQDSSDGGNYNLTVSIEYNTDLFTEATIRQYITHFEYLLNNMLTDVEMPVLRVGIADHNALLNELHLDSREFDSVLPLTPMQRDLYLDTLVDPDNRRNYFGWIQQIPQVVDATLFQQAIDILTAHFSSLRMRIVNSGKDYLDLAYAAILKPQETDALIKVRKLDWSTNGYDQATFIHHCNELAFIPYDLAQEPNLRFYLINAGSDRYAIVLTAHHACIDGVSLQSITELYTQVYAALVNNTTYSLPEDKYAEYVAVQIRQCDNAGSYHFWQQQAEHCDALSSNAIPNAAPDKPVLAAKTAGQYQAIYYNDSAEHLSAIRQYCETHNTTPALYIKALYTLMLQSYCYTDSDFYFTDIIAARPKEHLREVGCYFEQRPTVIKADVLNQTSSFGKLLQHLNDYRTLSRGQSISNSLIDKLFNTSTPQFLFNFYLTERYLPFMDVMSTTTIIAPEMDNAVSLITVIDGDHLQFNLTFVDSQFEQNHFVERLLHLSQQVLNGTEQLSALSLQLPAEQVSQPSITDVAYNHDSVVDAIAAQVKATPGAIAVKDLSRSLSYAELDSRANELAQYLVNVLHVQKGDNVALCLSANVDFMVALLATLKTGACYIPVDPHYPAGRIQHILNDAQARCIIAEQCSAEHIADIHTVKLFIDSERDAIAAQPATAPQVAIDLDDALYTIYTSGSTGLPKGASVKQRGELNLLQWYNREFAIGAGEKALIISALGFDLTQKNLLGPLCSGATIILPEMDVYDPQAALQIIAKEQITLVNCAPSAFYPLVENAAAFTQLQSLRVVLFGGEPIRMNALMGWLENPACVAQVVNMYGPTECTDISSFYRIEQPQQFLQQPVPIGHANDNVTLFVADSSLRLLPQGLVGELLVGGEGVGLGYRQLPEMTAEKFIDHPLAGKVYRTGDLVKQRDDGEYVFIGRIDHQVKLRGLRIELGEIEFALRQLPDVQDSLAMVNDDKLTGYILNHDGKVPENWRAVLGNFLPDYMMPQGIAALTAWPLSANGKIDRKALPALDGSRRSALVAPRNDTEEKLAAIWREVLGVNEIGVYDSFFELGGHSLLVVRAVARIRDQFQQDIPLRDVFFTPTIAAIADLLAHAHDRALPPLLPLDRSIEQKIPLSFAQQRLWFIDQLQPGTAVYNIPFALKLKGTLDIPALQQAFADLVDRHESLRTRIVSERGMAWQVVDDHINATLAVYTIDNDEQEIRQRAMDFLMAPFNLAQGPLVRAELMQRAESFTETTQPEYVLLICLHHIIADGWSIDILIRDLLDFYQSNHLHTPSRLPALNVQYRDYTVWQGDWLQGDVLAAQVDYWRTQLHNSETLELPTDFPRPSILSNEGKQHSFDIPAELLKAIRSQCQQQGMTLYMFLLGSFQILLSKYSNQTDISIGSPIANRPVSELENMVGLFINTLVLRSDVDDNLSVREFMANVKHTSLAAYQHQDIPFELLVDELHLPRELSQTPLFQVMLVLQNVSDLVNNNTRLQNSSDDLQIEALESNDTHTAAKFDLTLNLIESDNNLRGILEYRSKLFKPETMARFCEHFVRLLQAMTATPDLRIAELRLIAPDEIQQQLQWQHTHQRQHFDTSDYRVLHEMIAEQAEKTPQSIAALFCGQSLTYAELNSKANCLAHQLIGCGVTPESFVAIYQHRSLEMVISILATLKAGAAYVPIDPDYPAARVLDILDNCQPAAILTQTGLLNELPTPLTCIAVDHRQLLADGDNTLNPAINITPDHLAYVLFTSGSTGKPKGVMIEHAALCNHMLWMLDEFSFSANDRILQKTPYVFDASVWEFYAPLLIGATLVIAEPEQHKDPAYLSRLIQAESVTIVQFVPSLLEAFLHTQYVDNCRSLRKVFCGGEPLSAQLVNTFYNTFHDSLLVNLYGPTEATIDSSFTVCTRNIQHVTIGKPITNVSYYVLDRSLNMLPQGIPGELYIGGNGLARGYLNRDDLTAESFIANPFSGNSFSGKASDRLYKTGDRVRCLPDGNFDYLGRIDHQVKIRGFRIELNEVENQLAKIPSLRQAVAIVKSDERGNKHLLAYYTVDTGNEAANTLTPTAIREAVLKHLPEYMIPSSFIQLDEFPLTHNGKVDRRALGQREVSFAASSEYVAPRNAIEQQLAAIWEAILNTQTIGINDNFFELGGHSLLAIRLAAEIAQQFDRDISVRSLFEYPTIAGLTEIITSSHTVAPTLPAITAVERSQNLPLSFNQQGLYFIYKMAPEAASYNIPMALRLKGKLDLPILEKAVNALFKRHEILRTAFVESGDSAYQLISDVPAWQAQVEPLAPTEDLHALIQAEALQPFNLAQAPLLRIKTWQTQSDELVVVITLHHIIADAVTLETLVSELATSYHALKSQQPIPLAPLVIQYADYAWWQQHVLKGEYLDQQLAYWKQQLHNVPPLLKLPTDKPRPTQQGSEGAITTVQLNSQTVEQVRRFASQHKLTPFMVFLAAQQLLLGRYAKQDDVCIAAPIAGRHQKGTEHLPGYFVNALLIRNRFADNPSVETFFGRVKESVLAAFANQDAPLDKVLEQTQVERSSSYNPVAQVGFNYLTQSRTLPNIELDGLTVEPIEQHNTDAKYDMIWAFSDTTQALTLSIEYKTGLYNAATITRFIAQFEQLLNNMLSDTAAPVLKIPLISPATLADELAIATGEFEQLLPLTPMQRDLYLDTLIDPHNRRNYFGSIHRTGQLLDAGNVALCIQRLTAQYSALRMRIIPGNKDYLDIAYSGIVPASSPQAALPFEILDWSDLALDEAAFDEKAKLLCYSGFDLRHEPLLRFYLIKETANSHALVATTHHACIDAYGLQVLCKKLIGLYEGLLDDGLSNITSYVLSADHYPEYARQQYYACDQESSYRFWQAKAAATQPLSSSLGNKTKGQFIHHDIKDKPEHLDAIKAYCTQHNTSTVTYLKGIYALLLQSYCNAEAGFYFSDILAARPKGHLDEVGCYFEQRPVLVNTHQRFSELLQGLDDFRREMGNDKRISNSLQNQLYPNANAQFLFNYYLTDRYFPMLGTVSNFRIIAPQMNDAVNLIVMQDGDSLRFSFNYTDNVFEYRRFIERFIYLSQQVLQGQDELAALSLQLPSEQPLSETQPAVSYEHLSVVAAINATVKSTPNAIAVKDFSHSLSYAELDHRANELAQYLVNVLHVQKGDNVALCLSANVDFMVALLATLKTGACYIPVDPHYPAGRIQHILNDAQARCIIAEQCSAEHITDIHTVKLFIDAERDAIATQPATAPSVNIELDDALYTIYTSGSTGLPKGATVKQRGELNLLQWYNREFAIGAGEKVLIISALGFDLTQKNLLGPLCAGATIILPEMDVYDPQAALQIIAKEQITLVNCAPSAFYPLVENATAFTQLQSLRVVLFGGEPIRMNALMGWLENPACVAQVVNMYGPTECTDISSFYRIEQPQQFLQQPVPIGHANDNVTLFVADSSLRLLPQGLVGELLVGGEGVGLGYRQLPEMTAEKFIDHPLAGKVYRTGDLVKQRDDGEYVFIGRIDHQVKLRGLRIELGEIEFALRQLPDVQDSLAMVNDDKLTGYILNHDGKVPENWRAVLGNFLPDYMMPQGIAALTAWPLSANGKIDRKALPALDGSRRSALVAPRNDTEEKLAAIWREVLGVNEIGVYDSFFELGGHSLLVVRAVARIRDQFQQDIPLRDVFFTPTIAAIAEILTQQKGNALLPPVEPVDRDAFNGHFPLSFAQQRLWLLEQIQAPSAMYNIGLALSLEGDIHTEALAQAINLLVERHESLRTRIGEHEGLAYQYLAPASDVALTFSEAVSTSDLHQQVATFLLQPFTLLNQPLFKARLITQSSLNQASASQATLLLNMHHIISDGLSSTILLRELATLYESAALNSKPQLPLLTAQYIDYTVWQQQHLNAAALQQQVDYWRTQLQQVPLLALPFDHPRSANNSTAGDLLSFTISPTTSKKLAALAQQENATLFMVLLSAFTLLLHRYSGQDDIAIGTPVANRPQSALENMIGFFVNTLVMRSSIEPQQSFRELLAAVKHTAAQAYSHQDLPFERLLDELDIKRDLSHSPLFQAFFSLQTAAEANTASALTVAGTHISAYVPPDSAHNPPAKFELGLGLIANGDQLTGTFEYRTALFNADTIARLSEHFRLLLDSIVANVKAPLATLDFITASEQQQQLQEWNATGVPCDLDNNVLAMFEKQVSATPDAIAVRCGETALSYAQFNTRTNQLAHYLIDDKQLKAGARIVICQQANVDFLVSVYAAIKAGACYIPIDTAYPDERIQYIIEHAQADIVLCDASQKARFVTLPQCVVINDITDTLAGKNITNPTSRINNTSPLYMIYTSGSTGLPKGVEVIHQGETNLIQWYVKTFKFNAADKFLIVSAAGFDLTQKNFFAPLCSGGEVFFHGMDHYDPAIIETLIEQQGITVINCAPSALYPLIESSDHWQKLATLHTVLLGGEPIRLDLTRQWLAATDYRCELVNMYGPTECSDITTIYRIRSAEDIACATIPIGKPIANTQTYILDSQRQLLPTGLVGELYVGGLGVSNGYVRNDLLNTLSFIANPFIAGEKIYKTGDLVRYRADGEIEYIGRTDYQVKIRGLRIELGEIESAIEAISGIDQAIVVALRHNDEDHLVAYFNSKNNSGIDKTAIRNALSKTLPDYMIPGFMIAIAAWPLSQNGKINRKALPEPQWETSQRDDIVLPRTTLEKTILAIWQDVLKQTHISIDDNFFSIGGHSLKAVQVGARLRNQFTIDLALRDLFEAPTIAELALLIQQRQQQTQVMPPIVKASRNDVLPLSYAQQRLWFLAQMDPLSAAYNMPAAFMITGALDITALEKALQRIVDRHEVFRTHFIALHGEPVAVIEPHLDFKLHKTTVANDAEFQSLIAQSANTAFALDKDTLLRATVVTVDAGRHALLLNMHHIVSDGWSIPVFIRELGTLYLGYTNQLPDTLPELPIQYADYAAWQREWLQGDILSSEISYWRNTLKGVPLLLNMPLDRPRPQVQSTHGALYKTVIEATLAQQLRDVSIANQSTLFMTCLAAYQVLLHKYTHQEDICVGIPLAGRSVPGVEDLIGFFINALAIRTPLHSNLSLAEIIASVKETTLSAFAHDQLPVEMLINELGFERNLSFTPVIQCAFNMMSADDGLLPTGINDLLDDISIEPIEADSVTAKFEILLSLFDAGSDMQLSVEYNTDIYNAATIETLAGHYIDILQLFSQATDKRLYEICLGELALPAGYSQALPLTTMQRDIYLATLAKPDTLENSLGFAFAMPFAVDITLWQNILREITAQYAILRADLIRNKVPYQDIAYFAVSDSDDIDFDFQDWSHETLDSATIQQRLDALVAKPYDLAVSARVSHTLIKVSDTHFHATMAAHHMVLDGFAAVLIGTYLTTLYEKRLAGDTTPFTMEDHFAAYISENQQSFDRPATVDYWQQQFASASGLQAASVINKDVHETRLLSLPIPVEHYKAIRSYCKTFRITPPLYFKCLYAIMIQQYTRAENNFIVTEFQAGRNKFNKDSLGCFYHTNPTLVDIHSVTGSMAALFESAREQQKAIRDYLQISHLKQMQMMPPSGVYFSYNYLMMPHFSTMLGEVLNGTRYTPNAEGAVDLRVQAFGDELCFWLAYNTRLFDDNHLLERLLHISHQLVDGNIVNVSDIDFTLPQEIKTLSAAEHTGKLELMPLQISLQAHFNRYNIAVICGNKRLTYGELETQSNVIAQQLIADGVTVGDRVAICMGRRVELLVAILGAVKAGACYVPMDINYPADRLAYMLQDSAAAVLITESCMLDTLPATNALLVNIDSVDLSATVAIPRVAIGMDDLLYMIYTSGSTGLPKGATVYHRGEANLLAWYTQEFSFTASDRTLVMSAIGFDLTQKNLFALLTVGGTVVFPDTEHYDVDALLHCIEEHAITTLNCAPSAFYPLVELGGNKAIAQLQSLRTVLFGGEPIHLKRLAPWIASNKFNCSIVNMYGPTECTDISTFYTLSAQELTSLVDSALTDDYAFPLGKPNTGVSLYVLNDNNQPVPNGLPGELCIAGISVGAGYWNKPELTAKAFIPNPFATGEYDKVLYRTGDLVHLESKDGEPLLYYIGRKDFQVKLRGLRIELGEIEHALRSIPATQDTVVLVDNEQLLAFLLTDEQHKNSGIEGWREVLLSQLPDYMVPKLLIPVTAWPLTPNGKIDRTALLALERPDSSTQYVAPRTALEKDIAQLWQEVLGIGKAGVFDNFFEAGGDSLAAVRLVAGLEIRFNTKLPVSSLFGAQTISQLAHIINNQLAHWSPIVPIQPQGNKTPIFAVHALGAMVLSYEPLARALGKEQPFYGIQAYGFEEDQTPYTDLNEMLEFYVAAIRQQQPHGPYQIIGHSFGGVLAIEIARKLQSVGETVKFVGLLDTQLPISYADTAVDDALILKTFAEHNFGVVDIPLRAMRLMKPDVMIKTVAERFHGAVTEEFIRSAIAIIRGFQRMMIGFVMPPLDVPVILFKPEQQVMTGAKGFIATLAVSLRRKKMGWEGITEHLTVIDVPGDHHSMLKVNEQDVLVQSIREHCKE